MDVALSYHQHQDNFGMAHQPLRLLIMMWIPTKRACAFTPTLFASLGYEYNGEKIDSNTVLNGSKHNRDYQSVFGYGSYDLTWLQISGSLSYLSYKDGDSFTLPVLGLVLPFGQHHLYANAGKSVRVPTLNDLYLNQAANKGNPNLAPEETQSAELGTRLNMADIQTRVAVFARDTENAIDFTKTQAEVDANVPYYTARNVEKLPPLAWTWNWI